MLLNSVNYALKEAFYNLEKLFSGKKSFIDSSLEHQWQCQRLHAIHRINDEASLASGEFLSRARRGENLKLGKKNFEIVKEYVRQKEVSLSEEILSLDYSTVVASKALTKSIMDDQVPLFGLKASLHATADHASFDAWKNIHHLSAPIGKDKYADNLPGLQIDHALRQTMAPSSWQSLSVQTAVRLIDHPNTPAQVLAELAKHASAEVRAQVADNPNTSWETIMLLVKDESIDVRLSLAQCYHLGTAVLEVLMEDDNPYVCNRAETTLQRLKASTSPSVIRASFGSTAVESDSELTLLRARA
ncbi:MAG: hypothetical protein IT342_04150 [Candidatus Melainabacteria bacterium]|nr:hypothetical protein [Candidatus Melainabacteria bacterium]